MSNLIPVLRQILVPQKDGSYVVGTEKILTRKAIQDTYLAAAAEPFVCEDPLDPDFGLYDGLTIAEVMIRKQVQAAAKTGASDLIERIMDRLIGRPMARSENLNVTATYEDALQNISERVAMAGAITVSAESDVFGDML